MRTPTKSASGGRKPPDAARLSKSSGGLRPPLAAELICFENLCYQPEASARNTLLSREVVPRLRFGLERFAVGLPPGVGPASRAGLLAVPLGSRHLHPACATRLRTALMFARYHVPGRSTWRA